VIQILILHEVSGSNGLSQVINIVSKANLPRIM
jgi:hypothetical protein